MQATWLEDEDGYPQTASIHFGWIIVIVAFTSGTAALLLQLFLCLWVLKKSRSTRPLIAFFVMLVCSLTDMLIQGGLSRPAVITANLLCAASYMTAALLLRSEIKAFFRKTQGWEPKINPILTCFLSAIYINLSLIPSSPYTSSAVVSPLTTLNLSSVSAKITK